jgi:hypothetical protein
LRRAEKGKWPGGGDLIERNWSPEEAAGKSFVVDPDFREVRGRGRLSVVWLRVGADGESGVAVGIDKQSSSFQFVLHRYSYKPTLCISPLAPLPPISPPSPED